MMDRWPHIWHLVSFYSKYWGFFRCSSFLHIQQLVISLNPMEAVCSSIFFNWFLCYICTCIWLALFRYKTWRIYHLISLFKQQHSAIQIPVTFKLIAFVSSIKHIYDTDQEIHGMLETVTITAQLDSRWYRSLCGV